jgi:hypothetical protein
VAGTGTGTGTGTETGAGAGALEDNVDEDAAVEVVEGMGSVLGDRGTNSADSDAPAIADVAATIAMVVFDMCGCVSEDRNASWKMGETSLRATRQTEQLFWCLMGPIGRRLFQSARLSRGPLRDLSRWGALGARLTITRLQDGQ